MKLPLHLAGIASSEPKAGSKLQPLDLVRLGLLVAVVGAWAVLSLTFLVGAYLKGGRMTVHGLSFPTSAAENGPSVVSLLNSVPHHCPADRPFIMVNEDVSAYRYTDYLLYPARTVPVFRETPFGQTDLDESTGGCLVTMDAPSAQRIASFGAQLSRITCAGGACLYRISP